MKVRVASRALLGKDFIVNPLAYLRWVAFALFCCVFTARSATITYPNQAYSFSHDTFSPVPGAFNVKAEVSKAGFAPAPTARNHSAQASGLGQ